MRFELYTEKTVSECKKALMDRMEAKATKTRPAMDGYIKKGGKFSIAISTRVFNRFKRTTRLRGTAERENGVTRLTGYVPHGVPRRRIGLIIAAAVIIGLIAMRDNVLLGVFAMGIGTAIAIPLMGDAENSEKLIKELKKATKAKDKPPSS
mgnify:CR=1 FL=1